MMFSKRIKASLDWLIRSHHACSSKGSAAYWSPILGWGHPYPETTGYIIPTLWRGKDYFNDETYGQAATNMTEWLMSLQHDEGWFPGGTLKSSYDLKPSIFNSGQILFGLAEAYSRNPDETKYEAIHKCLKWLCGEQEQDGRWLKHAYVKGYSPSYYSHVCWPIAKAAKVIGEESFFENVRRGLFAVNSDRTDNGTYSRWAFNEHKNAFTHTIGYTLQGVIESTLLTGDWNDLALPAVDSLERLMRKFEIKKNLAGAYNSSWRGDFWYQCLTGHCQIASAWIRIYENESDPRFLNSAINLLDFVCKKQRLNVYKNLNGAIGGSSPLWGKYMCLRYPNWAAKFFIDAMMDLESNLESLQ
jgi:hypothetical protein